MDAQALPCVSTAPERGVRWAARKLCIESILCRLDLLASLLRARCKRLRANISRTHSIQVGIKLKLRCGDCCLRLLNAISLRNLNLQALKLGQSHALHVLLQTSSNNTRLSGATFPRMRSHADVVVVVLPDIFAPAGAGHDVTARRATNKTREQGRTLGGASRLRVAGELALNFVKRAHVDQGLMRFGVDVLTDPQLPQIDPIPEKRSNASWRHTESSRKLADGCASEEITEGRSDLFSLRGINVEPPILSLQIATRKLAALPDSGLRRKSPPFVKTLGVLLALMRVDADEEIAMKATARRAGVDALFDRNDLAASRFHPTPSSQLLGNVPAQAGEVRDDDTGIDPPLDPFNRGEQRRALLNRQTTGDIQLRRQDLHSNAVRPSPRFNRSNLVLVGMEAVRPLLSLA